MASGFSSVEETAFWFSEVIEMECDNGQGSRGILGGEKMKTCDLCGRVRDDADFVAAHCLWCDDIMVDVLEWV